MLGAGAAMAGAAAAAGYYFYGSDKAKKHRASAVKWAEGFKKEVVKEARMLSRIDKKKVGAIVDDVVHAYRAAKKADVKEIGKAASELKKNWHRLAAELKPVARKAVAKGRSVMKKASSAMKRGVKRMSPKKRR